MAVNIKIEFVAHSWVAEPVPRRLTERERNLLNFLAGHLLKGRDELVLQIQAALVKEYCSHCPSVYFVVDRLLAPEFPLPQTVPVVAQGKDTDGMFLEILLHLREGFLDQLELWRGDGGPIRDLPDTSTLKVELPT